MTKNSVLNNNDYSWTCLYSLHTSVYMYPDRQTLMYIKNMACWGNGSMCQYIIIEERKHFISNG